MKPTRLNKFALALALIWTPATVNADDALLDLSLEQLLEVNIVGASKYLQKQSEVAAASSVITRDEIKAYGWRTLGEALNSLPGIYTTYDRRYTYLGTRGFGLPGDFNSRLLITINGNRVNEVTYDSITVGREFPLDMDLIERIEFIPGPGGAVYGQNAMQGVINVVTRSGKSFNGAEVAVAYQDPQRGRHTRVTWGKQFKNGTSALLSMSGYRASGEDRYYNFPNAGGPGVDVAGVANGLDAERDKEFFAQLSQGPWTFDLTYTNRRKKDPTAKYQSDPLTPGAYERDEYLLSQLQYQDDFAKNALQLTGRIFLGEYRYNGLQNYIQAYGTNYLTTGTSSWRGAEIRLLSMALANHKLMFGMEAQDNTRHDQTIEDVATPVNNIIIPGSGWRAGIYAQDEWRIGDTLLATLGIRIDRNNLTGTKTSPRAGLVWQVTDYTTFKALYGRAHRAPNAYERDYDDGYYLANPALGGERTDTVELVADQRLARDFKLRGSLYHWVMRDIVVFDDATMKYQNGHKIKAHGLEVSADKTWNWGGRLRGSVSYQQTAFEQGDRLDNSPRVMGKLNFIAPLPVAGLGLGYELQYGGSRQTVDGKVIGGYTISNLNLMADTWVKRLDLSLGVFNLFDKHYQQPTTAGNWHNAIEQDGRSVRLKAKYSF